MKSWIKSANDPKTHFPLQNLPFGVARFEGERSRCVTILGDQIIDLAVLESAQLLNTGASFNVFDKPHINDFMELGRDAWILVRKALIDLFAETGQRTLRDNTKLREQAILPAHKAIQHLPFKIAEYTDFYAGMQHAKNMGAILRGSESLPANWLHIPIGYNGRASSIVVSGTPVVRPLGQTKSPDATSPSFGPTKRLDFELEIGAVIGTGSTLGQPVTVEEADEMIFGYVLLNDWSARDIQGWEYQPLGPFQGKAFATSISPWVITALALEEFRKPVPERKQPLLPYLNESRPGLYDINLEIFMQPEGADRATRLSRTNYSHMYYSSAQQLCHHAIGGCKMNTGDLLGSGTISGPTPDEYGSLMELSWAGKEPFMLDTGETRSFIEDGDTLTLTGWAEGEDYLIGFGECSGKVLPSPNWLQPETQTGE